MTIFRSVQLLSHVRVFATPWTAARLASLSITNSQSPPKPMSIESVMPSNHLILCHPLLLLPPVFPSISVFSNESALRIRWPKYWSFIMSRFSKWRHYQIGKEWLFHWFFTLICSHKLGENVWSLNTLVLCLRLVAQLCPALCNPMDCSPPGFSVHGILQARILEWLAFPFSSGSSKPGIELRSPALQANSLLSELPGKPKIAGVGSLSLLIIALKKRI